MTGFCQLNIGQLSRNKFWGEDEHAPRRSALCVSSLLWHEDTLLLVDPCMPFEKMGELIFNRTGRRVREVTAVFFTHPHGDHTVDVLRYEGADLYIAPGAEGDWINSPFWERFRPLPAELLPGVESVLLPGHTVASAGLTFNWLSGRAIIAGDAVMTRDFFESEVGYFNSSDFAVASETIRKIKAEFDFVIPGHDMLFPV